MAGGGKSKSDSSTTTTTNNTDKRLVVDGGSLGISNDGTLTYQDNSVKTDAGAVTAGKDIALAGINANATNFAHLVEAGQVLVSKQIDAITQSQRLTGDLTSKVAAAYSDAASHADGNKNLVVAGLAVVAVVAFASFKR